MFELRDFFHLSQLDPLFDQIVSSQRGLIIVAGLDQRPLPKLPIGNLFLPSGRSTLLRVLMEAILTVRPSNRCMVITQDRNLVRIPRQWWRRFQVYTVDSPEAYAERIAEALRRSPGLLVIDRLCVENAGPMLEAARLGLHILAQLDTVFRGVEVVQQLLEMGATPEQLPGLAWVLAVQRMPALCPHCKALALPNPYQLDCLRRRFPDLAEAFFRDAAAYPTDQPDPAEYPLAFYTASGCEHCQKSGRQGDVAVFDVFQASQPMPSLLEQPSLLPMEGYVMELARLGYLSLDDFLQFETGQYHRTFNLLLAQEQALGQANTALQLKLAELEAANRVLKQRTQALISLQEIGQTLISSTDLDDLAARICRRVSEMCGADRAILYYLASDDLVETLAVNGWDPARVPQQLPVDLVVSPKAGPEPLPYNRWPPGIPPRHPDVEGAVLRAGLYVMLIAQEKPVGVMIVHSTLKNQFTPGEIALLQTFANQAALAIQRAGLIAQLRAKIAELEAAQLELAQKERMERELEIARQVQQSVLPRTFPQVPGYHFSALNEPARRVGGDFYDVIALDDDHFGIVVGDASDKGMPAALYMALTRSLLLAEAHRELSPRAVLASVNQLLFELGQPSMFVTVFYGVVERSTRQLTFARAGHDRPFLLHDGSISALDGRGTALGIFQQDGFQLTEDQVCLAPADRLVLYTDGLMDVLNPENMLFDLQRLKSVLQSHADLPVEQLCTAVFDDLAAFRGSAEQYDDMTMVVLEVT
jgi:serine phosphatase RsbU (regulator of sigma subunit)